MAKDPTVPPELPAPPSTATKTSFEEFLIAEYNNIAQAFFNTVDSLSAFTKHYVAIASLPFALAILFLKPGQFESGGSLDFFIKQPLILPVFLTFVSFVGFLVLGYVVNLRFDAILYARTVNGIRKYFFDSSGLSIQEESRIRELPKSRNFPLYVEESYFLFVVAAITSVGTGYFLAGWYFYWWASGWEISLNFCFLIVSCIWLHFTLYALLGWFREGGYLRRHILGVDIDGVLGDHRIQFAKVLKVQVGKTLDPDSITHIPVHEMQGTKVSVEDEHAVFNWPRYWTDMPVLENADRVLQMLRSQLGYRVWVFTHREWPKPSTFPRAQESQYWIAWKEVSRWAIPIHWMHALKLDKLLDKLRIRRLIGQRPIRRITKRWLREHGLECDKLVIEGRNSDTAVPPLFTRNRYFLSKEARVRVFVEDDLRKARKLCDICDWVFLVDQPYNSQTTDSLPRNLIRAKTWQQIFSYLRERH